jgi:predicted DNA-binding transcriptional regulator AlpA
MLSPDNKLANFINFSRSPDWGMEANAARSALPSSLAPRGLSRREAAHYCGVSPNTFARAVADGLLPRPFKLYGRVLWCRKRLDVALDALSDTAPDDDTWGDYQ